MPLCMSSETGTSRLFLSSGLLNKCWNVNVSLCPQFSHHELSFFAMGKLSFTCGGVSNCYLQTDLLISWLSFDEISCSYRYKSSVMNKKCSCFVIAKYCLKKRANYCLREAEAQFYSFIFIFSFSFSASQVYRVQVAVGACHHAGWQRGLLFHQRLISVWLLFVVAWPRLLFTVHCIIKRAVSVNKGMNSEFKTVVILSVLVRLNIVSRRRTPQERVYWRR